jgi:hypothetical protein
MFRSLSFSFLVLALAAITHHAARGEQPHESSRYFEETVEPILARHCLECHSHSAIEADGDAGGGLVLDSKSGWEKGGDSGPAVIPGKPEESLLLLAVRYSDQKLAMPPTGKLAAEEIGAIEEWIRRGAPDPRIAEHAGPTREAAPSDIEAARGHWAFQPVKDWPPPAVSNGDWPASDVDRYLLARLEEEGLAPSPDADRHTWLRRVFLDLTGLPPSEEEIASFLDDESPDAKARIVDRLLGSIGFGERWGRNWLDLVGYADQIGTANDVFAEHAWRYRDYVLSAFNRDLPFDEFLKEQIAGDLMTYASAPDRADKITATGFLVLGDIAIVEADKAKLRVDLVDSQVDKIGKAMLAMTIGCARCHDHKFDPIPQRDYYALGGFFASTEALYKTNRGVWTDVTARELPETEEQAARRAEATAKFQESLAAKRKELEQVAAQKSEIETALKDASAGLADDAKLAKEQERDRLASRIGELARQIEHAEFFAPTAPKAFAVSDSSSPADMRITIRGNAHSLGESAPRGFLQVASRPGDSPAIGEGESGRLALADWIASAENPLTARVAVNRIWRRLFGAGLVRSVDYFGLRGETPSHPELLDALAARFVAEGWSTKQLVRELVLSRAYGMSSDANERGESIDPENRLLWRKNRERLDAEAIRDSLLAVSGKLVRQAGGPALPLEYLENVGNLAAANVNPPSFSLQRFRPVQSLERTVYLPVIRSAPQPGPAELRNVFDFTQPAEIAGQRPTTAVPTQALFLMNAPMLKERAADLAASLLTSSGDDGERLSRLWLRTLGRPILEAERVESLAFLDDIMKQFADRPSEARTLAWQELCHAVLASNEFLMRM